MAGVPASLPLNQYPAGCDAGLRRRLSLGCESEQSSNAQVFSTSYDSRSYSDEKRRSGFADAPRLRAHTKLSVRSSPASGEMTDALHGRVLLHGLGHTMNLQRPVTNARFCFAARGC